MSINDFYSCNFFFAFRTISSAPYNKLSKKSEESATPGSSGVYSENSEFGAALVSTGKDSNN